MNTIQPIRKHAKDNHGAALVIAIGMLFIIAATGVTYVSYMRSDYDRVSLSLWNKQAEASSERAMHAAIAQIGLLVRNVEDVPGEIAFDSMALYEGAAEGDNPPTVDEYRRATAKVTVTDECARLNLNYAPVRLLQEVLGVDGATARDIRGALPRPGQAMDPSQRWFLHVDELVTRRLLTPEEFESVRVEDLTVFTSPNDSDPRGYINLNAVSPAILAATCAIDIEKAEEVAEGRPYTSFQDFLDAVGKDAATFNVSNSATDTNEIPRAFALYSRTYRLRCEATVERKLADVSWDRLAVDEVEAVVQFDENGNATILSWRGVSGEL